MTANFIAAIHKYRSQTHRIIIQQLYTMGYRYNFNMPTISLAHSLICLHYFFLFRYFFILLCLHGAEAMNEFCWQISSSK